MTCYNSSNNFSMRFHSSEGSQKVKYCRSTLVPSKFLDAKGCAPMHTEPVNVQILYYTRYLSNEKNIQYLK